MRITLATLGSRGDIQPFLVLGDYFSRAGHDVTVVSAKMYAQDAAAYDVDFQSFKGDYAQLINDEEMKKMIGKNPFTMRRVLKEKVYPVLESSLQTFYEAAQKADIFIYHPKTLADAFGYLFPEKMIKAYVVPGFTPTRVFPSPLLPTKYLPSFLNKLSYKFTDAIMATVKKPVLNFQKKNDLRLGFNILPVPFLYGISPAFLSRPDDYPKDAYFTGFWFENKSLESAIPIEVRRFLTDVQPSVIITFGSMPYKSNININDFIRSVRDKTDAKVLIVKAWGLEDTHIETDENIMAIDGAPFDKLFPLASAIVHHGGAGTTAIALKSGVPQLICPVLHPVGDQYFWGKQTEKRGVGLAPIPLVDLTPKKLSDSVKKLLSGNFSAAAQKLKNEIAKENGLQNALEIIEKFGY